MNKSTIHIKDGKIIGDSAFFLLANDLLNRECMRLCEFTDMLDADPAQKKERIAEYKCAKYRYASVSLIHSSVTNNNRCRKLHDLGYSHYLLLPFDELFKTQAEDLAVYDAAPEHEKPDCSLYYAMLAFADQTLSELNEKLQTANDWEKIELEERIGGLLFAKTCLHEAWEHRGGETA